MKIAYFAPNFPPSLGGMGTACYYTANEIGKLHEVTVFLPARYNLQSNFDEVERKNIDYRKGNYKIELFKPLFKFGYAEFSPQVFCRIKNYDIVHLYYPYFGVAEFLWLRKIFAKFFKIKSPKIFFHYQMDMRGIGISKIVYKIYKKVFLPFLIYGAVKIFVLSEDYAQHSDLKNQFNKYKNKFCIVPNGVDIKKFKPNLSTENVKNKLNLKDTDKIIFTAQALDHQHFFKGIDVLIKAFKIVCDDFINSTGSHRFIPQSRDLARDDEESGFGMTKVKLIIAGDGDLLDFYKDLAKKMEVDDKIIFIGNLNHNELPELYNLSNVVAVPSTKGTESFSITAAESQACGTPVIVSNLPGLRKTIENGKSGLICQPNNEKDLAEKILFFVNNPQKAKEFGQKGRIKVAKEYDWKKISEKILSCYKII